MASREHDKNIWQVCELAVNQAGISPVQLDAIAYTRGPGLPGSLLVGASFAKGLAFRLGKPLISVHHMEAHILSLLIQDPKPAFPFLCLVVSGGHTMLVDVKGWNDMHVLGSTRDDSVGEAFDKSAKLLGLGYPGGKIIDDLAKSGNPKAFPFPVAKTEDFTFSYSGVKTSILYFLRDKEPHWVEEHMADICASIQEAFLKPLVEASEKALDQTGYPHLGVAGGVSANSRLRSLLSESAKRKKATVFFPPFEYCTDNAAMIGKAAMFKWENGIFADPTESTDPRWKIGG
jgi:N6-L-threonylcarbamoyladenine synthase